MDRLIGFSYRRCFCTTVLGPVKSTHRGKLDFGKLHHPTKVPNTAKSDTHVNKDVNLTTKTVQLLERLSLVNLDGQEALETLQSSLQFAENIVRIETENIKPLYMVLSEQSLRLRPDKTAEGACREHILQNAKVTDEDYFISPPGNIPLQQENK